MKRFELPPDLEPLHRKAVRLEWLTIAYLLSAILALYLTIGSSQAGKAALIEDLLSLTPPVAFLVAARLRREPADARHPWGHHRTVSIAYLAASLALLLFGAYILLESAYKLVTAEHPPMGTLEIAGEPIWAGWLILPALAWSGLPAFFLGRAKLPIASRLHDKVLFADAKMNRADWLTAAAGMVGVVGIGLGLWWLDAAAAIFISVDIVRDGLRNARIAVDDLMDSRPLEYDGSRPHALNDRVVEAACGLDWVHHAWARLREEGHVFAGEVHVVPAVSDRLPERVAEAQQVIGDLDWRLHDVVVVLGAAPREVGTGGG